MRSCPWFSWPLGLQSIELQGEIWCWSLLGLKGLRGHHWHDSRYSCGAHLRLCCFKNYCRSLILMKSGLNFNTKLKLTSHNIGAKADMKFQSANSLLFPADFLLKLRKKMQSLLCLTLHIAGITPWKWPSYLQQGRYKHCDLKWYLVINTLKPKLLIHCLIHSIQLTCWMEELLAWHRNDQGAQ